MTWLHLHMIQTEEVLVAIVPRASPRLRLLQLRIIWVVAQAVTNNKATETPVLALAQVPAQDMAKVLLNSLAGTLLNRVTVTPLNRAMVILLSQVMDTLHTSKCLHSRCNNNHSVVEWAVPVVWP